MAMRALARQGKARRTLANGVDEDEEEDEEDEDENVKLRAFPIL